MSAALSGCGGLTGSGTVSGQTGARTRTGSAAGPGEGTGQAAGSPAEAADGEGADQTGKPVEKGLLRIGLTESVETMDVQKTTSAYMVPLNLYERLFDIRTKEDGSTELVPGLAEDYTLSEDGRTYRFTLRDNAFFSDGTPVKASDVAFTFTRMLSDPDSLQTDFADAILGAEALMRHETENLEGVEVLDERHLTVTLSEPFTGYIYQLATPSCSILSEACVREAGDGFGTDPEKTIGSGPYRVTEFGKNRISLELNPFYQGEKPTAEKVELLVLDPAIMDRTFREGGLDLLDADNVNPDVMKSIYKADPWRDRLVSKGCVETKYLMLNLGIRPLNDPRVRKAVQMAINRQKILDELYDGDGTLVDGIYPRGLIGYSEENQGWLKYDPEQAEKLLREAEVDPSWKLELAANSGSSIRDLNMLEMIREDLQKAGFSVSVVSYDSDSRMFLRRAGKLMAYTGDWSADFNDPDNFIYTFFGSREKTRNRSGNYADEEVMGRIAAARTIQDETERLKEYADLESLLVREEAVWVPLFSSNHLYVMGERVESFTPYWAGWSSLYFKDVVLK